MADHEGSAVPAPGAAERPEPPGPQVGPQVDPAVVARLRLLQRTAGNAAVVRVLTGNATAGSADTG
ncbi:hypothetical protein ACGFXC_27250 [Streptomyces sp. NPDC048507]|uniref:hypothetical protein n=1 Tax=Streptomyces sp. NPDC048507 TaxID=3365560 RepID=UPI00372307A8